MNRLAGRRIMVVEDELLIAILLEQALEAEGCEVVGPFGRLADAMRAAERDPPLDAALLDINISGEAVFPVAEVLANRQVPFLLVSGYGDEALPPAGQHWPVYTKPIRAELLIARLNTMLLGSAASV